jgi:hypothetical protein
MKVAELLRTMADLIDLAQEKDQPAEPLPKVDTTLTVSTFDADINRIKQIAGLVSDPDDSMSGQYSNEPNEKYADVDSVTTCAGGGVNGPKNPADIRGSTQAIYPGKVWGAQ